MTFQNIKHCDEATYILWPERRWVPESTLWMWYLDACDNGEIAEKYLRASDVQTARQALSDAGIITLGQEP